MKTKIIRNYAVFMLLEGLAISFFFGTYSLFLLEKGLSLLQINLLNCSFMVATFLFEIPTGAIADFFGRKISVVIGLFAYSLSFLVYFLSDTFALFLVAEIVGALAFSCVSGALEALVVDSLNHYGYDGKLETIFRRGEIRQFGIIIGAVIGSFVGQINLSWPWLLSSLTYAFLAVGVIYFFREEYFVRSGKIKISFGAIKTIARDSISYGFKNRQLMLIVLFMAFVFLAIQPINMYWQIVFEKEYFVPVKFMGLIFAGIVVFAYLGSQLSGLWQKIFSSPQKAIVCSQLITLLGIMVCLLVFKLPLFLSFFFLHEIGRGLIRPLSRAYINNIIDNKNRATVLSFESMIAKAGAASGLLISGVIADNFDVLTSWLSAVIILFLTILFFCGKTKKV